MDRRQLESFARQLMTQVCDNLTQDGYVAFAVLLITRDNVLIPIMTSTSNGEAKEALATFLRMLAPHTSAIFLISEAWTLIDDDSGQALEQYQATQSVATHPNPKEDVFVIGQSLAGEFTLTNLFDRDADGAPTNVREHTTSWTSTAILHSIQMGRLSSLFL